MKHLILAALLLCCSCAAFYDPTPVALREPIFRVQQRYDLTCYQKAYIMASILAPHYAVSIGVYEGRHPYQNFAHAIVELWDTEVGKYELETCPPPEGVLCGKLLWREWPMWWDEKKNVRTGKWLKGGSK